MWLTVSNRYYRTHHHSNFYIFKVREVIEVEVSIGDVAGVDFEVDDREMDTKISVEKILTVDVELEVAEGAMVVRI